jgi:hypothetical protein
MMCVFPIGIGASLRHGFETGLATILRRLNPFKRGRRLDRRRSVASMPHRRWQHFGSLDDQLLSDLGLQRSDMRGAEYGILPGRQALHQDDAAPDPEGPHART